MDSFRRRGDSNDVVPSGSIPEQERMLLKALRSKTFWAQLTAPSAWFQKIIGSNLLPGPLPALNALHSGKLANPPFFVLASQQGQPMLNPALTGFTSSHVDQPTSATSGIFRTSS
mmetsp:Transcript_28265/g.110981  ORF Transcript_28265/g.110981 Transcript_28265/m.110981 type:complete len:115 (-) Transcript_28265:863-1207(-)